METGQILIRSDFILRLMAECVSRQEENLCPGILFMFARIRGTWYNSVLPPLNRGSKIDF